MANKAISELPQAQNVNNQDLFVLEQSGIAKKLTAETFITEQGIIDALAEALDGHGGIQSVTLQSLSGRVRTYLITFSDGSATTFQVYDGTSIERITKTSTAGLVDTYTIFMNDGTTTFFTVSNGADGDVSEATLNDALKYKAPVIPETTASSAIANFTDGADDMVMHNIVADIDPVQDLSNGDPSPTNICPITGHTEVNVTRTGKNLLEPKFYNGGAYNSAIGTQFTFTENQSVVKNGNVYSISVGSWGGVTLLSTLLKVGTYKINVAVSAPSVRSTLYIFDKNFRAVYKSNTSTPQTWTNTLSLTEDGYIAVFLASSSAGTITFTEPQIELGATFTGFEEYKDTTLTVDWSTEAGTVYGGTIDVATGLLTVTNGYIASYNGEALPSTWISDRDVYSSGTTPATGAQVVYALATPQTYQLTGQQLKTLYGTNNVWADTGNVSVTYPADTKLYIQNLTQPTEDDLVANQAITSGKYFMIGNSLYLALANIASGAQITIGTNAQRVSLADALNTINS